MISEVLDHAEAVERRAASGAAKAAMVARLVASDRTIPAGRVASAAAVLLTDRAAGGEPV